MTITADAAYVPVYHYGAGVHPTRTQWLAEFRPTGTDERIRCCASTHGHRTKQAAKACVAKTWERYKARAATESAG